MHGWTTPLRSRIACLALVICVCVAATAQAQEFDRRLPVARGTRLQVRLYGGEVVVHGWDRDEVRVRASLFRTDSIDVQSEADLLRVGARSSRGVPHAIDVQIDVPIWMAIDVKGTYLDIAMEGLGAAVTAETVRGDVTLRGGIGIVNLKSVEGEVVLEDARGQATLSAVNNGIRVTGLAGDLFAESVSGTVRLQQVEARVITVSTEAGDISWDGLMSPQGRYQFATHSGDVDVTLPERTDATIFVRPFGGRFRTTFPLPLSDEAARGKRFSVTIGTGAARLDLETFSGTISLRRADPTPR